MNAAKPVALLLISFAVGETRAEQPSAEEKQASPIFAPAPAPPAGGKNPRELTSGSRRLADLIRSEVKAVPPVVAEEAKPEPDGLADDTLHLERMVVEGKRIVAPPRKETPLEKFIRTGHLWEFSDTKRIMIGPHDGKVGIMFSMDW